MNNVLTLTLQAAVNHERIKIRIKDLQRAQMYLEIASEATERISNHLKMVERYDEAKADHEPWTWILTKDQAIKRFVDTQAAYDKCMKAHSRILNQSL